MSYKGAAYLGGLIFLATSAPTVSFPGFVPSPEGGFSLTLLDPQFIAQVFQEKRALETVGISVIAKAFETVGLATFLTWWGTRTNPFE